MHFDSQDESRGESRDESQVAPPGEGPKVDSRRLVFGLIVGAALLVGFGAGLLADHARQLLEARSLEGVGQAAGPPARGHWETLPSPDPPDGTDGDAGSHHEALGALPYLAGYEPPTAGEGVTFHVPEASQDGYNLLVSAHETRAEILDMDGQRLHDWSLPPLESRDAWGEHGCPPAMVAEDPIGASMWRTAHRLPKGDLVVVYEGLGVVRIDRGSRIRWARWQRAHHNVHRGAEGHLWVLEREWRPSPRVVGPPKIIDDQLVRLDGEGRVLDRISLMDAFEAGPWRQLLTYLKPDPDPFHTNSIRELDGGLEAPFSDGHLVLSIRTLDTVAVVDPQLEQVVWAMTGRTEWQHDAHVLESGHLLLFDNRPSLGSSRMVEIDPASKETVWQFDTGFFSKLVGGVQRLPNGNTLVTESLAGRAFEVTADGQVVWEWLSPYRVERDGEVLVAVVNQLRRLPEAEIADTWLETL